MTSTQIKVLTIFAPAKINLYLHVTGRLDNGYHTLDSLIAFADIGDSVSIEPAQDFEFNITGPYAASFSAKERDASPNSSNIAVQAAWMMARAAQKNLNLKITLTKNMPLAGGIGGGSSDAAAVAWGLAEWWNIPKGSHYLPGIMARLGADVPVCFGCQPARVRGIGDVMDPAPPMDEVPVVLVNPGRACPTPEVFKLFSGDFREPKAIPANLTHFEDFIDFLKKRGNDLEGAAAEIVPEINTVLECLAEQKGCALARMSGSGATCFGIFDNERAAHKAAKHIAARYKAWWVKAGWINRPERY